MYTPARPFLRITVSGIPDVRAALRSSADRRQMLEAAGRGVSNLVIRHLRARGARPGKPGWPKSNYWEDAASSTQTRIVAAEAVVSIHAPGIRLRRYGGNVDAKRGKAMAVPARPEVAGIWPSEYSDRDKVFLVVRRSLATAWLAERKSDGHLRILWWLIKTARHNPDPSVLPPKSDLAAAAAAAVKSILPSLHT